MSGSGNSNFGYGNLSPFLKSGHVNAHNAHSSQFFNSNQVSGGHGHGLPGAKSNIDAANSVVPGVSLQKGGSRGSRGSYLKRGKVKRKVDGSFLDNYFLSSKLNPRFQKNNFSSRKSFRKSFRKTFFTVKSYYIFFY